MIDLDDPFGESQLLTIEDVLPRLRMVSGGAEGASWSAACPTHDDRNPSLSVGVGADDGVLLFCHRCCPPLNEEERKSWYVRALSIIAGMPEVEFEARRYSKKPKIDGRIFTVDRAHVYYDDNQHPVYRKVISKAPDGSKRPGWFRNVNGPERNLHPAWVAGMDGGDPGLYLGWALPPEVPVIVVEGEKDADTLARLGLTVVSPPHGAGTWRLSWSATLAGRKVHVVADADETGRRHAHKVAEQLRAAGCEVTCYEPQAPYGDVSDAVEAGLAVPDCLVPLAPLTSGDEQGRGWDETEDEGADGWTPTWASVDLAPFVSGEYTPPTPSLMPRDDGLCLLYPGLTHSLHGESESGKSWIAQVEVARCLSAGEPVLYVDLESDPASVVARLMLLGVAAQDILSGLDYRQPQASPKSVGELEAWQQMMSGRYALAVIDGVTDALGLWGASTKDNDETAAWMRLFPKRLGKRTGAAVLLIDHVTKDADTRGRWAIGAQAKMSGLEGAGYTVDVDKPLGIGLCGRLTVRVAKDRPGFVRGRSGPMRADRTQVVGHFVFDATGEAPVTRFEAYRGGSEGGETFRPTGYMERVSRFLEATHGDVSMNMIEQGVPGKGTTLRQAVSCLIDEGHVTRSTIGKALMHTLVKPFREDEGDPFGSTFVRSSQPRPTSSGTNPADVRPSSPTPFGGTNETSTPAEDPQLDTFVPDLEPVPGPASEPSDEDRDTALEARPLVCEVCEARPPDTYVMRHLSPFWVIRCREHHPWFANPTEAS